MFVWQSSDELFAPIEHLFTWVAVFGLLSIILLGMLGYIAANRIVTPIRRLQEAAKLIGRGDWQEPITIKTGDEIEELADEINRMNQKLSSAFAGLESEVETKSQEVQYLQESTAQILDSVPDPVIMLDQEQQVIYLNRASKEAFQLNKNGQFEGKSLFTILDIDPATQRKIGEEFQAMGAHPTGETPEMPSAASRTTVGFRDPLQQATDRPSGSDRQEIHVNGQVYRYQWFGVRARSGQNPEIGLVFRDVTEESRLQDRLIKEEKLASIGVLSAGIGHELNNPLVGVIGLGEAIQDEEDPSQIKEYAQSIVQHGRRMASIIRDFTGQATSQVKGSSTQVNINEQVEHALNAVKVACDTPSLNTQTDYHDLPGIKGNPQDFSQAFVNIITNAVQAMGNQGVLKISTTARDQEVRITIQDNGQGIPHHLLPKIFDPFFTTKQQGEGSGLGLTIARRIIQKYAGQIQITSKEGEGTTCQITLPLNQKSSSDTKENTL
jgi:signal transduction histidine kinase